MKHKLPTTRLASRNNSFWGAKRAQTLNDFAIGTTLFLFTILFVFAFIPSIFAPTGISADTGDAIRVDRNADHLTQTVIGESDRTNVLNAPCTKAFFDNSTVAGCDYSPEPLETTLGHSLQEHHPMHITVQTKSGAVVTYDGIELQRGDTPPPRHDQTSIRRVVVLDGTTYELKVQTW